MGRSQGVVWNTNENARCLGMCDKNIYFWGIPQWLVSLKRISFFVKALTMPMAMAKCIDCSWENSNEVKWVSDDFGSFGNHISCQSGISWLIVEHLNASKLTVDSPMTNLIRGCIMGMYEMYQKSLHIFLACHVTYAQCAAVCLMMRWLSPATHTHTDTDPVEGTRTQRHW